MSKRIAFIINPKAGTRRDIDVEAFIRKQMPSTISYDTIVWEDKDDFQTVARQIHDGKYTIAVACGGDGTVNQVAAAVRQSSVALGILPLGSGNGLARSLGIPMNLKEALQTVTRASAKLIDSGEVNGKAFFCTCGIGFDAHIAEQFASSSTRGFWTYFKISLKEFFSYTPQRYSMTIDGKQISTKAFLITVGNAGQWGNDVYIAPEASLEDGIFHVSVLKPFPKLAISTVGMKLMRRRIHLSRYLDSFQGKDIEISFEGQLPMHFDGEPFMSDNLKITMNPGSLKVVC